MSYNLLRVFEEVSKIQDSTLIHPSDKKYTEALKIIRQQASEKRAVCESIVLSEKNVRISSYTIRAVQNAIITRKSLVSLMNGLVARLVLRVCLMGALMIFIVLALLDIRLRCCIQVLSSSRRKL